MGSRREPYETPAIQAFASELTAWRTSAELSKHELAEKLGYSPQWIGQIEAAKNVPSDTFARDLDTFFKTNGLFFRLWERIRDSRHRTVMPSGFAQYVEEESEATGIRAFDAMMVNGLLQTEAYMRVVFRDYRSDVADKLVADRLERQSILTRDDPPHAWFTIDEFALRRPIGGPQVMREQLQHLLDMGQLPNVRIDVVLGDTGYYTGMGGSFILLSFADDPDSMYIEAAGHGMLIQNKKATDECGVCYNSLRGDALPVRESRKLIARMIEEVEG